MDKEIEIGILKEIIEDTKRDIEESMKLQGKLNFFEEKLKKLSNK